MEQRKSNGGQITVAIVLLVLGTAIKASAGPDDGTGSLLGFVVMALGVIGLAAIIVQTRRTR